MPVLQKCPQECGHGRPEGPLHGGGSQLFTKGLDIQLVGAFGGDAIIEVETVVLEVNFVWRYLKVVSIR